MSEGMNREAQTGRELFIEFLGTRRRVPLPERATIDLGRSSLHRPVDLDLDPDHQVSRLHARLTCEADGVWVEDLGSLSGTWIGDRDIRCDSNGRHPIRPGEPVTVGRSTLKWYPDGAKDVDRDTTDPKRERVYAMELTQEQVNEFVDALVDSFSRDEFEEMLLRRLGVVLENAVDATGRFPAVVLRLVQATKRAGWSPTLRLLNAAVQTRSEKARLIRFAQQFDFTVVPSTPELERQVTRGLPHLDIARWLAGLVKTQARVCRVTVRDGTRILFGTAFLVARDIVMTNHHVVAPVLDGRVPPEMVEFRFDYSLLQDGTTLNSGKAYSLAPVDWFVDASPPSSADSLFDRAGELPSADELDYALLRMAKPAGSDPINPDSAEPGAPPRGWIQMPTKPVRLEPDDPLFIIQHPEGKPVKLALDTKSIITVNANRTRVRHRTNTDPGSSGAPCFDIEWQLIALHHSGDPAKDRPALWNEGIPIDAIFEQVAERSQKQGKPNPLTARL